jgi:hypothetical protein
MDDLTAIVARNQRLPRRAMISGTLEDIAGGAGVADRDPGLTRTG